MKLTKIPFILILFLSISGLNILKGQREATISNDFQIFKGINIASWLSTPKYQGTQRVAFFTEKDVKLISDLGFDHIRICVDEVALWDENGNMIRNYGFDLLHSAIGWCEKHNLRVIVDLHITRNHRFTLAENLLFTNPDEPAKFVKLWEDLSDELSQYPNSLLAYELLNEPCSNDAENWNRVAALVIGAIRAKEPDRTIVVGVCTMGGTVRYDLLELPDTHKVLMTFHYYGPFLLTYYGANSTTGGRTDIPIQYPGQLVPNEWISALPEKWQSTGQKVYNKEILAISIQRGLDRAQQLGVPVFVGEFGTWNLTPEPARTNWYRDVVEILNEKGNVPYTSFDYKGAGYSVVSESYEINYSDIVEIITGKEIIYHAIVRFDDLPDDINLASALFTFVDSAGVETRFAATKIDQVTFDVELPSSDFNLRKVLFQTIDASNNQFEYYFPPQQKLIAGEQTISIAPPDLFTYWQGGMIMTINETLPLTGTARYNISGTVMAPVIGAKTDGARLPWFPNNTDVTTAMSTTNGITNTAALITALGGPGTSPGTFAARFAYWLRSGGYADWYLPVANEYLGFNTLWKQDSTVFKQKMYEYGGVTFNSGTHKQFWTSENINATQAKLFDIRNGGVIAPGGKIYGLYCFAFRKYEPVYKGPTTLNNHKLDEDNIIVCVDDNLISLRNVKNETVFSVYDLSGRMLLNEVIYDNYATSHLRKGIYIITLMNKNQKAQRKVVLN